jgi:5-methylcytosine-specific restriction protein A
MTEQDKIKHREACRKWREKNREKSRLICKSYRENNREKVALARTKWNINPNRNRNHISFKKRLMKKLCDRDGRKCKKCGSLEKLTIQHIIPRCLGGGHDISNLEILCFTCNIQDYHLLVKKALKFYFENHRVQITSQQRRR